MRLFSSGKTRQAKLARRVPSSYQPRLEAFEDRCLLSAGALDPTFGNGAGYVTTSLNSHYGSNSHSVLIQPDGKILAAGNTTLGNGSASDPTVFAVVRYNTDGSLDASFGSGGHAFADFPGNNQYNAGKSSISRASALYPQAGTANDGKIVLAGEHFVKNVGWVFAFARFNTNGTLDATFGTDRKYPGTIETSFPVGLGYGYEGVVIQSDGKIVMASGSATGFVLARYTANGALDSSFGSGGKVVTSLGQKSEGNTLLLQPDGKLIVVGDTYTASGWDWEMARYNPNGSLDTSFGSGGFVSGPFTGDYASAYSAALYASGTPNAGDVVVVGNSGGTVGSHVAIARFNPNGTLDSTFGVGGQVIATTGIGWGASVAIAPDGKLVVPGRFNDDLFALARFKNDGSFDSSFGTGGIVNSSSIPGNGKEPDAVALQPNGDIVVVGWGSLGTANTAYFIVARYLPSAPQVGSFTANPNPVTDGSSVTLAASNITDANPSSTVTQVAFHVQVNGSNTLLGYGTQTSPGVWTFTFTVTLAPGTYTLFAQAEDNYGVFGDPLALTLTVQ